MAGVASMNLAGIAFRLDRSRNATAQVFEHLRELIVGLAVVPSLVVGLIVAMFQAATQINEQTLSFLPRLIVMLVTLIWSGPWLVRELMEYTQTLIQNIPYLIG